MRGHLLFVILVTIIIQALTGCRKSNPDLSPFTGVWESKGGIVEVWSPNDANGLRGRSFSIEGSDTIQLEMLAIRKVRGNWYYVARVMTQNEGKEIFFKLLSADSLTYIFENPEHDYPQRIGYCFSMQGDSLTVYIETLSISNPQRNQFIFNRKGGECNLAR